MAKQYDIGDLVECRGSFRNASGAGIDPSVVKAQIREPNGTVTTYTYGADAGLVKNAVGLYSVNVDADAAGEWHYRFFSTGTGQAAAEGSFVVRNSSFV